MDKSPNLKLTLTPVSEGTKNFIDFRSDIAGDSAKSNMMILDREVGNLIKKNTEYETNAFTWGMLKNGLNYKSSS